MKKTHMQMIFIPPFVYHTSHYYLILDILNVLFIVANFFPLMKKANSLGNEPDEDDDEDDNINNDPLK